MDRNFEITRCKLIRESTVEYTSTASIGTPEDIVDAAIHIGFNEYPEEIFGVFCVNTKHQIIAYHQISQGSLNSSMAEPREVFKRVLLNNAFAIFLVHNHPSGNSEPSYEDVELTNRLTDAGKMLNVPVLDHIIIGDDNYYSFKRGEKEEMK